MESERILLYVQGVFCLCHCVRGIFLIVVNKKKKKNESFDKIKKRTFRTRRTRIFKNLNFNYLKRSSQQMVYAYAFFTNINHFCIKANLVSFFFLNILVVDMG